MATGFASWKLAKGLYIVPVLFAFTPFLSGNWPEMLRIFAFAVIGIYALSAALQGCMENPFGVLMRVVVAAAGVACLWPGLLLVNSVGVLAVLALLAWNIRKGDPRPAPVQVAAQEGFE